MKYKPHLIAVFVVASGVFFCCGKKSRDQNVVVVTDSIRTSVIQVPHGFGYEIYYKEKKIIYQPVMPAMIGNMPFSDYEKALSTANYVASKIRKGIMPPAISLQEMDSILRATNSR